MYKLPLKNTLLTAHIDPDADSVSSCRAVAEYLKDQGKRAAIRVCGAVPSYLQWMLAGEEVVTNIPEWVEQVIVLDCGPERVGWEIPADMPIVNIDHHKTRFDQHSPRKKIYVKDRCSTAAILILDFGIVNSVLFAGLYGDTLFLKSFNELNTCFSKILKSGVKDDTVETILSNMRPFKDRRIIDAVRNAKVHRCRNGFTIAELKDNEEPGVIEQVMRLFHNFSESVCLIQPSGQARLRTSNPHMDVSKIAELFQGGGHKHAAGLDVSGGKGTALKTLVRSLEIEPNFVDLTEEKPKEEVKDEPENRS